jgi:hypothetical protein
MGQWYEIRCRQRNLHACIRGWADRRARCLGVSRQIECCDGSRHVLLFRGEKSLPLRDDLFIVGRKARPFYCGGDPDVLRRCARFLVEDAQCFGQLVKDFVASPIGREISVTTDELRQRWIVQDPRGRLRLSQLLLYAMQWQNCKDSVRPWRDYLLLLSATSDENTALHYALSRRRCEQPPKEAFILEYAPPVGHEYFEWVADVRDELIDSGLCAAQFCDRDREAFILYALMPHFILGYSHLRLLCCADGVAQYACEYVGNPAMEDGCATLAKPRDLDAAQRDAMLRLGKSLAWVYRTWGATCPWLEIQHEDGAVDISDADL